MNFFKRFFSLSFIPTLFVLLGHTAYYYMFLPPWAMALLLIYGWMGIIWQLFSYYGIPCFSFSYNKLLKRVFDEIMSTEGEYNTGTRISGTHYEWKWKSPKTARRINICMETDGPIHTYEVWIDGNKLSLSVFDRFKIREFFCKIGKTGNKDKEFKVVNDTLSSMLMESYEKEEQDLTARLEKVREFNAEKGISQEKSTNKFAITG